MSEAIDVHALRHTFGTQLSKGGVAPCTAQNAGRAVPTAIQFALTARKSEKNFRKFEKRVNVTRRLRLQRGRSEQRIRQMKASGSVGWGRVCGPAFANEMPWST
jgi:hypothetical protein